MNEQHPELPDAKPSQSGAKKDTTALVKRTLARRYAAEKRFRFYGVFAIAASLAFLAILLTSIFIKGWPAFTHAYVNIDIALDQELLGVSDNPTDKELRGANFGGILKKSLRERFPDVEKRKEKKQLYALLSSSGEYQLRDMVTADRSLIGQTIEVWLPADDELAAVLKSGSDLSNPDSIVTRMSDLQLGFAKVLSDAGDTKTGLNKTFFTAGDSREPEQAGIRSALVGSALTLLVTFLLSFPVAVAAAIYLEEFAPQNRWTDIVEVNINNLAAVPSIVFGLLGLAVFINYVHLPRSAPVVGGIVLSLMTLPTIIIASRAALKAVPPSIREAGRGLGASEQQVVWHHVLPLAMPGILTGTIIGLAQALGETAPLLMIGMVAFIVDIPAGFTDAATVLPVQVFLWADSPERAFVEKTSAAIIVLLVFLILMNAIAVLLRKKFERRW